MKLNKVTISGGRLTTSICPGLFSCHSSLRQNGYTLSLSWKDFSSKKLEFQVLQILRNKSCVCLSLLNPGSLPSRHITQRVPPRHNSQAFWDLTAWGLSSFLRSVHFQIRCFHELNQLFPLVSKSTGAKHREQAISSVKTN